MPVRPRQLLERHGWLLAIVVVYLYVFPYFPRIHSANELPRAYLVQAIANEHTFAIDSGVRRWGSTADVSPYQGRLYSNKAPGASLIVVPVYELVKWTMGTPNLAFTIWLCRMVAGVIPAVVFLWLLWGFLERYAPDPAIRRLVVIAYALGSMAMTYSLLYYSHQLAAVCIASAWILALDVVDRRRGLRAMLAVGGLAGAAVLVDYQAAFAEPPLLVYLIARMWKWPRRELVRALALAAAAQLVPIAILLWYHAVCFGSPLRTGYDASETFAHFHQHGFLGMTTPTAQAFWGSTFSADNGLFTLAPWWLLAIRGGYVLWRRGERGIAATSAAIAFVFLWFVSSINFWRGGWGVGPRYITEMLPFLLPLVAAELSSWRDRPLALGVAGGMMLSGVVIYSLSTATFPYWPDSLRDPLYEVTFRLLGDGAAAPSLGSACGISGLAGMVPFFAVVAGLVGWGIVRVARWRGLAVAVAVAAVYLACLALVPHGGPEADRGYRQTVYPAVTQ